MKTMRWIFAAIFALTGLIFAATRTHAGETCLELRLSGEYAVEIPCPDGTRPFLERLPGPTESGPRRDLVIDPQWPHDRTMIAEHEISRLGS